MNHPFLLDLALILGMYLVGVLAVLAAYQLGHRTWKTRFKIHLEGENPRRIHGQWGEIGSLSLVYGLLLLIDYLTQDTFILAVLNRHAPFAAVAALLMGAGIFFYSFQVCSGVRLKEKRGRVYLHRLKRGYMVYNFYSLAMYCAALLLVVLITQQFLVETHRFQAASQEMQTILDGFAAPGQADPDQALSMAEVAYGRTILGSQAIMSQIGTLILVVLTVFAAYFAITFTPLSQVYEQGAVKTTHAAFLGSLAFVALMAWIIYFTSYASFFDRTITHLAAYRGLIESGSGDVIAMYNELMLDLHRHRGPTGFILTLTGESGWLMAAFGAVQWLWGRRSSHSSTARAAYTRARKAEAATQPRRAA